MTFSRADNSGFARWWWTIDRIALAGMLGLMAIGLVLAFAASPAATGNAASAGNFSYALKQLAFGASAIGILVGASMLDFKSSRVVSALVFALALIGAYDIVADGSDNFATRYLVADACYLAKKPLVTAAVGTFDGTLTTIRAHERGPDGKPNPTYRCLFPEAPPAGTVPACAEAGILGALTGVLGSLMALEVIREIVGFGEGLIGRLLMVDARSMRFETVGYRWDPSNPLSGERPTIRDLSAHS